ncbi:hypothetical protein MSAN_02278000 [Mycena sanguinolenta]|uniref:Protein kinase domain-containing protein n=1 Tax=Mycena sanguinolenta TaxID=230812 RepID=A0A8H7CH66_9AGAR|nr:hypothetical protein MSAN_02278000 [Mycena sanguinolenta]
MDLRPDSDPEIIVLSTSDAKSTPYPGVVSPEASRRARKAKPFIKSFSFLPSLRKESFKTSGIRKTRTRKYWETKPGRQATEHTVNKYSSYHITGGFGGSGGEGVGQGGDGGTGQGPTIYFGQPEAGESSEFQIIRLGDIKLIKEFKEMRSSVVGRQMPGASVRRVYMAKIQGRESGHMTVAMYEGDGAEKAWNQHLANYESIRHPNILQLYGLVSSKGLYAMVFHDELIPYRQFRRRFEHLPVLSTYAMAYCEAWLAQANRMFTELEKNVHVEDYVCAGDIQFILRCSPNKRHINPEGYLFVCPARDLRTSNEAHANLYQWPACPAYWSLDPSGADCLSTEDAKILGFPTIHIETNVKGCSWDRSVYRGLRRFHEGKGHNPESREAARRLGYPLYEVLSDRVPVCGS